MAKQFTLYSAPLRAPKDRPYAVRDVIGDDWSKIPTDLREYYDELWMVMRPVRDSNTRIDLASFAVAIHRAGLHPGGLTVPLGMDQVCMHWCRYCAMDEARLERAA